NNKKIYNPVKKWVKVMQRHFSKEDMQMSSKYMKRCSTSFILKEMQIKIMRHHFTPAQMTVIIKTDNNKCLQGCGEIGPFVHCWWSCRMAHLLWKAPLWRTVWRFLKKLKIELPYDPAIALFRYLSRGCRWTLVPPMFIAALSTISKVWKEPKCPLTDEWIKKMWYVHTHIDTHRHTHNGVFSAVKQNEILPFVTTWMELECVMLSETSQSEKDKYHMTSLKYGI
ncbi:LORF2 protein, partial [Crocuta crocuta]